MNDPIADYLTRLRNGIKANKKIVDIPSSSIKKEITKVLHANGFIQDYKFEDDVNVQGQIRVALKYNPNTKKSAIVKIERISKLGLRKYTGVSSMPRVLNGLGIAIVSTSKGVMTNKEALRKNVGGEVLCHVY